MQDLRRLAFTGVALFAVGWVVGWFERYAPAVGARTLTVRPDELRLADVAWLLLVPLVVAPFLPFERAWLRVAWVCAVPALAGVFLAGALRPRQVVPDVPIGEVVRDRTLGQAFALVGALFVLMALVTAWQRAPDWRDPERW